MFQTGEGTPYVSGLFEVTVNGKLVHSKKVINCTTIKNILETNDNVLNNRVICKLYLW